MKKIVTLIIIAVLFYHTPNEFKQNIKEKAYKGYFQFKELMYDITGESKHIKPSPETKVKGKAERGSFHGLLDMDIVYDDFKEKANQALNRQGEKNRENSAIETRIPESKKGRKHIQMVDQSKPLDEIARKIDEVLKILEVE